MLPSIHAQGFRSPPGRRACAACCFATTTVCTGGQARTLTDEALAAAPDNVRVLRLRARLEADADNHDAAREVHASPHPLRRAHLQQHSGVDCKRKRVLACQIRSPVVLLSIACLWSHETLLIEALCLVKPCQKLDLTSGTA